MERGKDGGCLVASDADPVVGNRVGCCSCADSHDAFVAVYHPVVIEVGRNIIFVNFLTFEPTASEPYSFFKLLNGCLRGAGAVVRFISIGSLESGLQF